MQYICVVPPILSDVNFESDPMAAAMLADPYDEIVVSYPIIVGGNPDSVRLTNQTLQLLTNHQVWIAVNTLWPDFSSLDPSIAYQSALDATYAEMLAFWSMVPPRYQHMVKGFAFDHTDLYRMFGNYNINTTPKSVYRNLDRYFTNSLIQFAHCSFNRPAMLITNKPSDLTGNVYRYDDASPSFPGAAKWPTLLGGDSSFVDYILGRDMFFTPTIDKSTSDRDFTPGAGTNFQFADGTLGSWWRFFESLPVLQQAQSDNLNVGILQHIDFSATTTDYSLSPNLTAAQQSFLSGMNLFLSFTGIEYLCVRPVPANGQPSCFIPSFTSVSTPSQNISSLGNLPPQSGKARVYSVNGCVYIDYMSGSTPVRIVTDEVFANFEVNLATTATSPPTTNTATANTV